MTNCICFIYGNSSMTDSSTEQQDIELNVMQKDVGISKNFQFRVSNKLLNVVPTYII